MLRELVRLSNQSRRERRGLYPNFPVNQKQRLSYQLHHHPSKHWVVTAGTARVTLDDQTLLLTEGKSIFVPCCTKHRLENPGLVPLVVIEVQCGEYLGEDDIIRFNDDYARV
ncbi:phosphomannose isomerase type II C-terminal cupin domain [Candidatus Cyanaurora vandensis]|uniref:phosphomannose isomerase type II C-terminal cupin domain n=1 Tax=Candidatus Cyanaurora vandensis TaxID=2714958 RepID=UPI0037C0CD91